MKTILIVEDVAFNLDLLVQLLEDDYTILTASDGAAGIALAERTPPDLILMDLSLPVIDGWEATRRIKANAVLRSIPIIALTAHALPGQRQKCLSAGMDDYLSKPVRLNAVREVFIRCGLLKDSTLPAGTSDTLPETDRLA